MMPHPLLPCLIVGLFAVSSITQAAPLRAEFVDVVEPDAELQAFLADLVQTAQDGIGTQSRAYAVLDTMIAPEVQGFSRGLDPLDPWRPIDLTSDSPEGGIDLLAQHMVEQGDLSEDSSTMLDPRQGFLELVVALVGNPAEPLGTMIQIDNAVCSPARLAFDANGTIKFAERHDTDAYGIYLYPRDLDLHSEPDQASPVTSIVPSWTLLTSEYQDDQPENWIKVYDSEGTSGWAQDRGDHEGLSQQHLCFGKANGEYKIVGFFTYGL